MKNWHPALNSGVSGWLGSGLVCLYVLAFPGHTLALEQDVRISVYQGPSREGEFTTNLEVAREVVVEALRRNSQFLLFPECYLSGYRDRTQIERGARELNDPELRRFIAESAAHDLVLLIGLARNSSDGVYNSTLVIQRGALLGVYDKITLTPADRDTLGFKPGSAVPVFTAHGARFAIANGAETRYPHVAMSARWQGAEILFAPHHHTLDRAAGRIHLDGVRNGHIGLACQLRMVVARANTLEPNHPGESGQAYSFVLSPQGQPLAEASPFKSELITASVTPAHFQPPYIWGDLDEVPGWLRTQLGNLLTNFRRPTDDTDLRFWLENMLIDHRFTTAEVSAATGLTPLEIAQAVDRLAIAGRTPSPRPPGSPLRVLPYPGGRHPRIGFLEGAVTPQRETKISVFSPWSDTGYVVADVPEAIWSNLGLTYLAHSHIDTVWTRQGVTLPPLEWNRRTDGSLDFERTLPNGIAFGTRVVPAVDAVRMETWLRNGTAEPLTQLRLQNCVMLKGAPEFAAQTDTNKVLRGPYAACRSTDGRRWVITAWQPLDATWQNPPLPCMHSNGRLADCGPGETVRAVGWLSFFEGTDIEAELDRIESLEWGRKPFQQ
jgi:predicted amidohydrolase